MTEARQGKPYIGSWTHWLAQGQAKKKTTLSTSCKMPLSVYLTVCPWETDCRLKSSSFHCLASQFFMLIKVSRELRPGAGRDSVPGCGSVHICREMMICSSWESVPLSLPLLERNLPEGRYFLHNYGQNLKTCKKLGKYLCFEFLQRLCSYPPQDREIEEKGIF